MFPQPTSININLREITVAKLFCILDLASGYLQVSFKKKSKAKTAYTAPTKTGIFERIMFGLTNAHFVSLKITN